MPADTYQQTRTSVVFALLDGIHSARQRIRQEQRHIVTVSLDWPQEGDGFEEALAANVRRAADELMTRLKAFIRPVVILPMTIPRSVEYAEQITDPQSGLSLLLVRQFWIGNQDQTPAMITTLSCAFRPGLEFE